MGFAAKKAPAAPKKAARRVKKPVEDEEDSDADFPSSSKAKKTSSRAKDSDADSEEEENLPPRKKRAVESDSEDYVAAAPVASKRRVVPVRASAKRAAVIEPESSDYES